MGFAPLFWQLLNSNQSYASALRSSFNPDNLAPEKTPSKQALCQARKKLLPSAFSAIDEILLKSYYESVNPHYNTFCDLRVLGVDGSNIRLEDTAYDDMIRHYENNDIEVRKALENEQAASARCSLIYDVLNELSIDGKLYPTSFSEMEMLIGQLSSVGPNDVLVMDRGYNAYWFYAILCDLGIKFIIRAQTNQNVVRKFISSGNDDDLVTFKKPHKLTASDRHQALIEKAGVNTVKSLDLRLIRYELETNTGTTETYVMLTNLVDQKTYPTKEFKAVYKARWRIEEAFKTYKVSIEIERWSGISWFTAQQDFYSSILLANMTRVFAFYVDEEIKEESRQKVLIGKLKDLQKLSITDAIRCFRTLARSVINNAIFECEKHLRGFCESIKKATVDIREGRRFSYDRKNNEKRFYMSCKTSI